MEKAFKRPFFGNFAAKKERKYSAQEAFGNYFLLQTKMDLLLV